MRKLLAWMLSILLCSSCMITASAAGTYHTARDLYEDWSDCLPDYICGVWVTDDIFSLDTSIGDPEDHLTFGIQNTEEGNAGIEEMRSLVTGDYTLRFVYQEYSRNYLLSIQEEIDTYFEKNLGLVSTGLNEKGNCIDIQIKEDRKDHADTQAMVDRITTTYGKAVQVEYTSLRIELTVGENQSPYATLMPHNQPAVFLWIMAAVLLTAVVLLIALRRRISLLKAHKGTMRNRKSSLSVKEVEGMIKASVYTVPPALDQRIMAELQERNFPQTKPKKKIYIPVWAGCTAAAVCLCLVLGAWLIREKDPLQFTAPQEEMEFHTPLYSATVKNGSCILSPKISLERPTYGLSACGSLVYPSFHSVKEMRQGILSGQFTWHELFALSVSSKSQDGGIALCDPNRLYDGTAPEDLSLKSVKLCGKSYHFEFSGTNGEATVYCVNQEEYTKKLTKEYKDFLNNPNVTVTQQRKTLSRFATEYHVETASIKKKYICYEITRGDMTMYVQEAYILDVIDEQYSGSLEESEEVPSSIYFWGTENGGYFHGTIWECKERPTKTWLSQFGLVPYNP